MSLCIDLPNPAQTLRLELFQLLLPYCIPETALELAPLVEAYVTTGSSAPAPMPVDSAAWPMLAHLAFAQRNSPIQVPVPEPAPMPPCSEAWTEDQELQLERLVASGLRYREIAERLKRSLMAVHMRASETGITKRWPRARGGKLLYQPYPLDAPWPPPEDRAASAAPAHGDMKSKLIAMYKDGLETAEICERTGLARGSVTARATNYGMTDIWRLAREKRRAQQAPAPAEIDVAVTCKEAKLVVSMPPPAVSVAPSAHDLSAAALVVDKPGHDGPIMVARDVLQGQSWAFRDHRTLAEVGVLEPAPAPTSEPVPAPLPLPPADERQRLIDEHIAKKGLTTTEPDFGPDQPAIDVLRNACNSLVPAKPHVGPGRHRPWILNGTPITTERLWQSANAELKSQGKRPIKRKA